MKLLLALGAVSMMVFASTAQARTLPIFPEASVQKVNKQPHHKHHVIHHKKHHRKKVHRALTRFQFSALIHRTHPCLAHIVDNEDGTWEPTRNYGGGYGDTSGPYGLGQANPGTKMAPYGHDWKTSLWTQFRWLRAYARKFGSECSAWYYWQAHRAW